MDDLYEGASDELTPLNENADSAVTVIQMLLPRVNRAKDKLGAVRSANLGS
jgi:hypothetical protein